MGKTKKKVGRPKKKTTGMGIAFALLRVSLKLSKSSGRGPRIGKSGGTFRGIG